MALIPDIVSPYLVAVAAGWIVAQGLKYLFVVARTHDWGNLRQLYLSGNMPSAHSATVMALTTLIGFKDGMGSGLFGLAALFASVVMYDAMMVRRSSGEQGMAIQELIKSLKSNVALPRSAKGHTPLEVVAGAMIGVAIGAVVFIATK
jgi:acid phosphatase family membrane protein YuiD